MLKITNAVEEIINSSEIALTSLSHGYLNFTAFAESIHKEVERKTKKPVKVGSIVVALSRLANKYTSTKKDDLLPTVELQDLTLKTHLMELTFERTQNSQKFTAKLYADKKINTREFFVVSQGVSEITIISTEDNEKEILRAFGTDKPTKSIRNLVAFSLRFDESYLQVPNTIYSLIRPLALKQINLIEVVSTYSELTFILERKEMERAFEIFNNLLHKKNPRH